MMLPMSVSTLYSSECICITTAICKGCVSVGVRVPSINAIFAVTEQQQQQQKQLHIQQYHLKIEQYAQFCKMEHVRRLAIAVPLLCLCVRDTYPQYSHTHVHTFTHTAQHSTCITYSSLTRARSTVMAIYSTHIVNILLGALVHFPLSFSSLSPSRLFQR